MKRYSSLSAGAPRTLFAALVLTAALALGATAQKDAAVDFGSDVLPVLSDRCFACHGPDESQRKTKLRFDTEAGAFAKLAEGGFAIVRSDPEKSVLLERITSDDPARRMPPAYLGHGKLSDAEIERIRRWIEQGAEWQKHWSFTAPRRAELPTLEGRPVEQQRWPRNAIDRFVLARLDREGLKPSPETDRATLIRRVTLDLTGLPPTPAEVDAFVNDPAPEAHNKLVDRLLNSPHYGEKMASHWLDAARYADTNGYQSDGVRSMWRWRDWVIGAFNRNMPFDQFTIEQIAGDLLPNATRDQIIATGFNRNHRTTAEGGSVEEEFRVEYVADRVETTSTVWMGLTVGCARCHDHKYDPITQKEFYQLFAYFNNVPERGLVYNFGNEHPYIQAPTPEQDAELAELDAQVARTRREFQALEPKIARSQKVWEKWLRNAGTRDWSPRDGLILHFKLDGDLREDTGVYRRRESRKPLQTPDPAKQVRAAFVDAGDESAFVRGRVGQAASLDGKRHIDGGPGFKLDFLDPFSFAAWIRPTSANGAILSKAESFRTGQGHGLYLREGKVFLYVNRRWTDISLRLQTERALKLNQWQHVLVTYNGKRAAKYVHIYINGEEWAKDVLFDELTFPFSTKEPFRIGAGGGEPGFEGLIDDVRVYDRALSADEAAALPLLETVAAIAAIAPKKRTPAQRLKMRFAFLDLAAPKEVQLARQRYGDARRERELFNESIPTVMVMKESETPRDAFVLRRGSYDAPGEKVAPGVPSILPPLREGWENNRLGLARWLVDPANPLTARVTVNRFWQNLFGVGLVKTVEDFGTQGERPVHPELLDWLASEFVESGWDVKALLKTIVTSATYRQASKVTPELIERDPENRLLARGPRYRLPAGTIRDQALAVSGLLVDEIGGPSVRPYQPEGLWVELTFADAKYQPDTGDKLYRRSLYTYWKRTVAPPAMMTFDATDRETCTVRETRTNTPLQALNLMNDVTYVEASRKLAERMMTAGGATPDERIAHGFRLALARTARPKEQGVLRGVFERFRDKYADDPDAAAKLLAEGESEYDESLDKAELAAYAGIASLILNLDEAVTKE